MTVDDFLLWCIASEPESVLRGSLLQFGQAQRLQALGSLYCWQPTAGLLTLHITLPALELGAAIASAPADKKAYWGQLWMCCAREATGGQK